MINNILVVDDSEIIRKIIIKAVAMTGTKIGKAFEASNGEAAMEILNTNVIDVMFTDLNMPKMSGVDLIERMSEKQLLETLPVVVITADRNDLRLAELKESGVRACINKPFHPEALNKVIQQIMGTG